MSRECANRTKIGSKTDSTVDGPENKGVREDEKAVLEARRESRRTLFFEGGSETQTWRVRAPLVQIRRRRKIREEIHREAC